MIQWSARTWASAARRAPMMEPQSCVTATVLLPSCRYCSRMLIMNSLIASSMSFAPYVGRVSEPP